MTNTTAMIGGKEYVFQGVTDLEVMPLAEVFGAERPEEGTKKYKDWERQFVQKFCEPSGLRVVAMFLRCAFPGVPEETVKYTVRRLPDGTEECRPGIDLWVKISAKEFEQIVLIISSELKKIEQKLSRENNSRTMTLGTGTHNVKSMTLDNRAIKSVVSKQPEPVPPVLNVDKTLNNSSTTELQKESPLSFEEFKRKGLIDDILSTGGINSSSFDADGNLKNPEDLNFIVEAIKIRNSIATEILKQRQ